MSKPEVAGVEIFIPIAALGLKLEQRKGEYAIIATLTELDPAIEKLESITSALKKLKDVHI